MTIVRAPFKDAWYPGTLPAHGWAPAADALIRLHWERIGEDGFDVALLLSPDITGAGASSLIVSTRMCGNGAVVPFLLQDRDAHRTILRGRLECRPGDDSVLELWLQDAQYPGGALPACQISQSPQQAAAEQACSEADREPAAPVPEELPPEPGASPPAPVDVASPEQALQDPAPSRDDTQENAPPPNVPVATPPAFPLVMPLVGAIPVGGTCLYLGVVDAPDSPRQPVAAQLAAQGWMPCDGRTLLASHYPTLYMALASTYGVNTDDGSFTLPDLRNATVSTATGSAAAHYLIRFA